MILITIALAAVGIGGLGLYAGLSARRRATRAVEECTEMMRRRLQVSAGATDDRAIRDVAIVHYDALREESGGLSFSLALLNSAGDGVVLTSINGRTETRTYAKIVQSGRSLQLLSPEEDQVVRAARLGQGPQIRLDDGRDIGVNSRSSTST
ncbi:DUF4446 family protein [Actinoallomurus sp. CA-150999]|uniref:DUF4446 family protein n=1 Tax=Actinoallomurus sp. CA-150999 TaxID=3239887 RepID=UPI003D94E489